MLWGFWFCFRFHELNEHINFPKKVAFFQNFIETLLFREIQFHLKLCDDNNNYSLINSVKEEDIQEESSKEASTKEENYKEEDLEEGQSQKEEVKYPWMRPC